MQEELTLLVVEELPTAAEVDTPVRTTPGVLVIIANSVRGCVAGQVRPDIALALQGPVRPDRIAPVFAGADVEATETRPEWLGGRIVATGSARC